MNAKFFYGLSIFAVAFALVLGFGTLNAANAVPGENGDGYTLSAGTASLFGFDPADNVAVAFDRDADLRAHVFDSYGLWGVSQQ